MLNYLQSVFASFQSHDGCYVVIGGIAAVLHGVPRATFDLDILIEATVPNAERLLQALRHAGFGTAELIDAKGTAVAAVPSYLNVDPGQKVAPFTVPTQQAGAAGSVNLAVSSQDNPGSAS